MSCGPALVIGLSGGIATGKSLVAAMFASRGAGIIDADIIARELVEPGEPALAEIVTAFGPEILDASGALARDLLRTRVFDSASERRRLEAILHPRINGEMGEHLRTLDVPYALLVIPLLLETAHTIPMDRVLMVDTSRELQIERTMSRDQCSRATVEAIIAAQAGRTQRRRAADDWLDNTGGIDILESGVQALHERYLALAHAVARDRP